VAAKPLKLKRERAKTVFRSARFTTSAQVLIDHDITHLDQPFTYGLPDDLKDTVKVGSRVVVPFKSEEKVGIVLELFENQLSPSKPIIRTLNQNAYTAESLKLAGEVASRYASSVVKILRYIPESRVIQEFGNANDEKRRPERSFEQFSSITLKKLKEQLSQQSKATLILVPSEREASQLLNDLSESLGGRLIKAFSRSKPPKSFPLAPIVVGTRAAIFWQIPELSSIVIFHENSEHFWSDRSPFWNVRDVALIRSRLESLDLHFISGFPSMEIFRLLEFGYLKHIKSSRKSLLQRRKVRSRPDTYHQTIREGLKAGVVLVQVATKDYSPLVTCKNCRTRPTCVCGFYLKMTGKADLICTACGFSTSEWRCNTCGGKEKLLLSRGARRIEEELGKAFPSTPIHISTSDKELEETPDTGIVVATPGMEPRDRNFAALVLLDGELQLNRPTLRAEERLLDNWFTLLQFARADSSIFIDLNQNSRVTQSIAADSPFRLAKALSAEREKVKLPPWYRIVQIKGEELGSIQEQLKLQFPNIEVSKSKLSHEYVLRIPVGESEQVIQGIYALAKYRSASRKALITVAIDPHDL
jgi:primosomal protein N' (replication factor Y)